MSEVFVSNGDEELATQSERMMARMEELAEQGKSEDEIAAILSEEFSELMDLLSFLPTPVTSDDEGEAENG